jgi:hypothetical protein
MQNLLATRKLGVVLMKYQTVPLEPELDLMVTPVHASLAAMKLPFASSNVPAGKSNSPTVVCSQNVNVRSGAAVWTIGLPATGYWGK